MTVSMIGDDALENKGSSGSGGSSKKASVAARLVSLAHKAYDFGTDTNGKPFAVRKGHHVAIPLLGGKRSLRKELNGYFYKISGLIASQTALTEAMEVLGHEAEGAGDPVPLYLRAAIVDDVVYIDIGDKSERVIKVSADGWEVLGAQADIPVLFRRTNVVGALPTPTPGGDLDQIWDFVNLKTDADRDLIRGWLVAAMVLVGNPCPILALLGEQGTAKTSSARRLFSLFDPSEAAVRRPPNDADRLMHAGAHSRGVIFDNLSSIPRWMSDGLCRAVTGESDVDRALYTDDDARIIQVQGVLGFTAIDVGALAGDLVERCVWGNLRVIPKSERRSERDLNAAWDAAYPSMVGGLLDLVVQTLGELPDVDLEELPRMADFAEVLAAVDLATGSTSLQHYTEAQAGVAEDIVGTDAFLVELTAKVTQRWSGTGKALYDLLQRPEGEKYWPEPRGIWGKMRRVAPDLRKAGWGVDEVESRLAGKAKTWVLVPPGAGGPTDAELVGADLAYEQHVRDIESWEHRVQVDGATDECLSAHVVSYRSGASLSCEAQGCTSVWHPHYQQYLSRSKVIDEQFLNELDKTGLSYDDFKHGFAERQIAIQ